MTIRTMAGAMLVASTLLTAATSASASCGLSIQTPTSTVTPEGDGDFAYGYTLTGVSGSCVNFYGVASYTINSFEVPYFADAGITDIVSPSGWTYAIDPTDTFGLGGGAETLVWSAIASGLAPTADFGSAPATLSGFGYTAGYSSVYAKGGLVLGSSPYANIVDPALPGSPEALAAGLKPTAFPVASTVPEPSVALALLAGLGVLGIVRRRRA